MQINATVDDRIIYIPIIKTCCILGPQNWLKVLNLLPTSSCLLPVQLAGVKCQKMEIIFQMMDLIKTVYQLQYIILVNCA